MNEKFKVGDKVQLEATVRSVDTGDADAWVRLNINGLGLEFSRRSSQLPDPVAAEPVAEEKPAKKSKAAAE